MLLNIDDAKNILLENNTPIILIDTCSLMDIIRTCYRDNINISHLVGASEVIERINQNKLSIVLTNIVKDESLEHKISTLTDLLAEQRKVKKSLDKLIQISTKLGISYEFIRNTNPSNISLDNIFSSIIDNFINHAIILDDDDDCYTKATKRSISNITPSQKGKGEIKDCVIIEHYLKLVTMLRNSNYTEKIVFITNNSNDFGGAPNPRQPLNIDFNTLKISYCNDFKWCLTEIDN